MDDFPLTVPNLENEQMWEWFFSQIQASQHRLTRTSGRPNREEIELRAYQIFLGRGGLHGRDLDDWLEAERELLAEITRARTRLALAGY